MLEKSTSPEPAHSEFQKSLILKNGMAEMIEAMKDSQSKVYNAEFSKMCDANIDKRTLPPGPETPAGKNPRPTLSLTIHLRRLQETGAR